MSFDFAAHGIDTHHFSGEGFEQSATCPRCSHLRKKKNDKCLRVNIKEGVWFCQHCGWSDKADGATRQYKPKPTVFSKPKLQPKGLTDWSVEWFEARGITKEVLERNRVTTATVFMPQLDREVSAIAFPYYHGGEHVNTKYRDLAKNFRQESGARKVLYGYDDIGDVVVIVEGEADKLSVEVAGISSCVSVPDGAPSEHAKNFGSKFDWLDDEHLADVKTWIIAVDNDGPGRRLQQELIRRFGAEKCLIVTWPEDCKDANDVLVRLGAVRLRECIDQAVQVPIDGVFGAGAFRDDFLAMYEDGVPKGLTTGWDCIDEYMRIQAGQLLIVTGIPGHGKSEWVDALCVNLALDHGWKTAFYSPENLPVKLHMMKLAEKVTGKPMNEGVLPRMSKAEVVSAADWIEQHCVWVMPDQPTIDEILGKAAALVLRKGIRVLVIDPWNEIEHLRPSGMTEAEYVSSSLGRMRRFARLHDVLLIVVAHPRLMDKKIDGSYPVPTPYDISGGANWRNKADNCVTVFADPRDVKGAIEIHVQKVKFKNFGKVGMAMMTWDRPTGRYFTRLI